MNIHARIIIASLLTVVLLASACAAPSARPVAPSAPTSAPAMVMSTVVVAVPPAAAPTAAKASPATPAAVSRAGASDVNVSPYQAGRMIIKNGEMNLLVADTDQAIDRVTGVAVETGGYIVSSKTWTQDGFKYASLTMGVPVDQFEAAQRRLRALAVQVLNETASGQDVSDEYVDTQSRLVNLEATAARIREFLKEAKDVNEALQVNAKLAEVEDEINKAKGRMQYLKDRAAYSTLAVNLEPQRPTPTPTLTPTPTPTPTITPTPTPDIWRPDQTFKESTKTLADILRALGDLTIRFVVIFGPCGLPILLIVWAAWRYAQRNKAKRQAVEARQPAGVQQPPPPTDTQ
jgi:hypothetical protein